MVFLDTLTAMAGNTENTRTWIIKVSSEPEDKTKLKLIYRILDFFVA